MSSKRLAISSPSLSWGYVGTLGGEQVAVQRCVILVPQDRMTSVSQQDLHCMFGPCPPQKHRQWWFHCPESSPWVIPCRDGRSTNKRNNFGTRFSKIVQFCTERYFEWPQSYSWLKVLLYSLPGWTVQVCCSLNYIMDRNWLSLRGTNSLPSSTPKALHSWVAAVVLERVVL